MILKLTLLAFLVILSYGYDLTIDYLTCYKNKHCRAAGEGNQCYKLVEHFRGTPGYCFTTCLKTNFIKLHENGTLNNEFCQIGS